MYIFSSYIGSYLDVNHIIFLQFQGLKTAIVIIISTFKMYNLCCF